MSGLDFHKQFFESSADDDRELVSSEMTDVEVRVLGQTAVICYGRVIRSSRGEIVKRFKETRVWHLSRGRWRLVHFHRSINEKSHS